MLVVYVVYISETEAMSGLIGKMYSYISGPQPHPEELMTQAEKMILFFSKSFGSASKVLWINAEGMAIIIISAFVICSVRFELNSIFEISKDAD